MLTIFFYRPMPSLNARFRRTHARTHAHKDTQQTQQHRHTDTSQVKKKIESKVGTSSSGPSSKSQRKQQQQKKSFAFFSLELWYHEERYKRRQQLSSALSDAEKEERKKKEEKETMKGSWSCYVVYNKSRLMKSKRTCFGNVALNTKTLNKDKDKKRTQVTPFNCVRLLLWKKVVSQWRREWVNQTQKKKGFFLVVYRITTQSTLRGAASKPNKSSDSSEIPKMTTKRVKELCVPFFVCA